MLGSTFGSNYKFVSEDTGDVLFEETFSFAPALNSHLVFTDIDSVTTLYKIEDIKYEMTEVWIPGEPDLDNPDDPVPDVIFTNKEIKVIISKM